MLHSDLDVPVLFSVYATIKIILLVVVMMMVIVRKIIVVICVIEHIWRAMATFPKHHSLVIYIEFVPRHLIFETWQTRSAISIQDR